MPGDVFAPLLGSMSISELRRALTPRTPLSAGDGDCAWVTHSDRAPEPKEYAGLGVRQREALKLY